MSRIPQVYRRSTADLLLLEQLLVTCVFLKLSLCIAAATATPPAALQRHSTAQYRDPAIDLQLWGLTISEGTISGRKGIVDDMLSASGQSDRPVLQSHKLTTLMPKR